MTDPCLPLSELRILDLSSSNRARACVGLFGMLGADVWKPRFLKHRNATKFEIAVVDCTPGEPARLRRELSILQSECAVVISLTPFGLDGPDANDLEEGPILSSVSSRLQSQLCAAHAAVAGLAGLRWARRHHRSVLVEVAAIEVVAACLGDLLPSALCLADQYGTPSPQQVERITVFGCNDGYVGISALASTDRLDLAVLSEVASLANPRTPLVPALGQWLATQTRAQAVEQLQALRIPAVPALHSHELLEDEQHLARGMWQHESNGQVTARTPFRFTLGPVTTGEKPYSRYMSRPLADLRVVDLGMVWAGPYCGRLLAGLGATLVKVESPTRHDGTRLSRGPGCQGVFADLNRGKSSLCVDLAHPEGRDVFIELLTRCDAVIESFSPRVMPNLGLSYGDLVRINPSMLMVSMPAFGSSGPWRNYTAYGSGLELASGLAWPGQSSVPRVAPVPYLDFLSGTYAAVGILAALISRDATGQGRHVEVAQREVASQLSRPGIGDAASFQRFDIPASIVAGDPQLIARRFLWRASNGSCVGSHVLRLPFRLHGVPSAIEPRAPALGADTVRILTHVAGVSAEKVATLRKLRIVETMEDSVKYA